MLQYNSHLVYHLSSDLHHSGRLRYLKIRYQRFPTIKFHTGDNTNIIMAALGWLLLRYYMRNLFTKMTSNDYTCSKQEVFISCRVMTSLPVDFSLQRYWTHRVLLSSIGRCHQLHLSKVPERGLGHQLGEHIHEALWLLVPVPWLVFYQPGPHFAHRKWKDDWKRSGRPACFGGNDTRQAVL